MDNVIPAEEKARRSKMLRSLSEKKKEFFTNPKSIKLNMFCLKLKINQGIFMDLLKIMSR